MGLTLQSRSRLMSICSAEHIASGVHPGWRRRCCHASLTRGLWVWFLYIILNICTQIGYIGDHELLPTDCVSSLEGWLRRGVVSSEAASKQTPRGDSVKTVTTSVNTRMLWCNKHAMKHSRHLRGRNTRLTCHMSLTPTAKAMDPPPDNSPTMHSMIVHKDLQI